MRSHCIRRRPSLQVHPNLKSLVKLVKTLLRSTGSVNATVQKIVNAAITSPKSNDNVSMVLIVFNQFGVVTGHTGAYVMACNVWCGYTQFSSLQWLLCC